MDEGLVSDGRACRYRGRSAAVSLFLAWALFLASPLLRYSLCRLAQRSHLAVAWRVLAFPALGWPARLDFLRQGHGPLELIGFIGFGAPLGVVLPAGDSVLLSAFLAPRLSFDGGFNAVSAEAAGFGFGEFLLTIGSLYFSSGLGRQWDSFLFGILFFLGFLGTITLFGFCGLASFAFAFLATLLSFLAGTLGFVLGRPFLGSGKVCWNIILLEHCAGIQSGQHPQNEHGARPDALPRRGAVPLAAARR